MNDLFDKIVSNKGPLGQYAKVAEGCFAFPKDQLIQWELD